MLEALYTSRFERDVKRLARKHFNISPLSEVIDLILLDTPESRNELIQHHSLHSLKGIWAGSNECHVANVGDWLVIWKTAGTLAVFERTGSHDELFR